MDVSLGGSHRSTRITSDLALQALASQAKLQRESESQAECTPIFGITGEQANIARFSHCIRVRRSFRGIFPAISDQAKGFSCRLQISSYCWRFVRFGLKLHRQPLQAHLEPHRVPFVLRLQHCTILGFGPGL